MPLNFAVEASDLGRTINLSLSLLLVNIGLFSLLEINPSPLLSLGYCCTLNILSSLDFPLWLFTKSVFKEVTWALSYLISSALSVSLQVLEEIETSLLKKQDKADNSHKI
jgi:hypothetical protein